jgi:hypothetical protein
VSLSLSAACPLSRCPQTVLRRNTKISSRRLFPETRELQAEEEEMAELTITNTEIASSLPLQMLLYFNVQYSLFWGILTLALMVFEVLRV